MINNLIDLLNANDFYGISENIEIAKGKNELPNGWGDVFNKIKRHRKMKKETVTWKSIFKKIIPYQWQTRR